MVDQPDLVDPWQIGGSDSPPPTLTHARPLLAWLLSLGMLAEAWRYGGGDVDVMLAVAFLAAIMEVVLRSGHDAGRRSWGLRVGAVVGLTLPTAAFIGPTPAALVTSTLLLADGALCTWQPTRRWPQRTQATATLSLGLIVAAELVWFRSASRALTAGLLVAAAVTLELYARRPAWTSRIEVGIRRVSTKVVWLGFELVLLVVSTIILYLPGMVLRAAGAMGARRRWRTGRSTWIARSVSIQDQRRDARRPFVSTEPAVRSRRLRRGLTAVAVVVFLLVAVLQDGPMEVERPSASTHQEDGPPLPHATSPVFAVGLAARYSEIPAYRGVAWADQLQKAQGTLVVDGNQTSRYRNIRNGDRVTIPAPHCDCPRLTMWISGGSAVFGEGQRDSHTIASELVRTAARDGISLDVRNVSRDGYTFQMEAQWQVLPRLHNETPPQLLVFYDGFNDVMAELAGEFLHGASPPLPQVSAILPPEIDAINERSREFLASGIGPTAGRAAALRYRSIQAEVDAAASRQRVRVAYFFQADALTSEAQLRPYQAINGIPTSEMLSSPLASALATMSKDLEPGLTNFRSLLAAPDPPYFLGLVHHNEAGARVVADAIYGTLRKEIREMAR